MTACPSGFHVNFTNYCFVNYKELKKSKKIFLVVAAVFFIAMIFLAIDLSRRTEFRKMGGVKQIEKSIED